MWLFIFVCNSNVIVVIMFSYLEIFNYYKSVILALMGVFYTSHFLLLFFLQFSLIGQVKLAGICMLFRASSVLCELSVSF